MPVTAEQLLLGFQSGELKPVELVDLAGEVPIVELAKLRDALLSYGTSIPTRQAKCADEPTLLAAADSPRPEQAEAFTMPGDNCFGLDDHQGGFPVAPHAPQPDPEDSISGRQFQPFGSRTPQDGKLLPQGEVFQS